MGTLLEMDDMASHLVIHMAVSPLQVEKGGTKVMCEFIWKLVQHL